MAALNELDMAAEEKARDDTAVGEPEPAPASGENIAPEDNANRPSECSVNAGEHSDPLPPSAQHSDSTIRRLVRGLLKPLLAIAIAQYALVTALVALTAYAVASHASKLVNASLEPIIAAFKRL